MLCTAVFSKQAMFKFHDVFFIRMTTMIDHSYDRPVEMRNYHFQTFLYS